MKLVQEPPLVATIERPPSSEVRGGIASNGRTTRKIPGVRRSRTCRKENQIEQQNSKRENDWIYTQRVPDKKRIVTARDIVFDEPIAMNNQTTQKKIRKQHRPMKNRQMNKWKTHNQQARTVRKSENRHTTNI
ncbi:Hypothetical protein CINCED_3A002388 [Cinara cedri]|uniref:Uncharacterized protein n=1 Tax=Cinara cedri TaxID=506608 RepID=A0A5E4MF15_9HEMI|nr:Hypothetical protein CINCED_3A002388 [Cinara cedri]